MLRRLFHAMGTEIELLIDTGPRGDAIAAVARAEAEFHRLEALLSRFRPDSELSQLNRSGRLTASRDLVDVLGLALEARERTRGRFDPTVHDALVAAGYDRSFDELEPEQAELEHQTGPCGGAVALDRLSGRVELAPGTRVDLGGIAKGYAAARACAMLEGVGPCLVNAGGDIAVGTSGVSRVWPVGVDTPQGSITVAVGCGGLATSGRDRRRWLVEGRERHHLIDPATGAPSESDLLRVTAVADSVVEAEIAAKSLLLAGAKDARAEADSLGIPAVLVTTSGETVLAGGLG